MEESDTLKISIGVWIAKGLISWCDSWRFLAAFTDSYFLEGRQGRTYLPLAQWLLSYHYEKNKAIGMEMAGSDAFFYSAMATNQLMYKYFTFEEQQKIYAKLTKQ